MKTITVKLPEDENKELEEFVKKRGLSKSEFVRHLIIEKLDRNKKEKMGWLLIAEKSMNKLLDNKKDEEKLSKYL